MNDALSGELHIHLDGSMRLSTIMELAPELGIALPGDGTAAALREFLLFRVGMSLQDCLAKFAFTVKFLQRRADLERATRELVEDQAERGVPFTEIRFAPHLHTSR